MKKQSLIVALCFGLTKAAGDALHAQSCRSSSHCITGLVCRFEDNLFDPQNICRCPENLEWVDNECINQDQKDREEFAELVTILVPVLSSVVLTLIVALACCCWIHSSNVSLQRKMTSAMREKKYEDIELEDQQLEEVKVIKATDQVEQRPKTSTASSRITTAKSERPKTNGHVVQADTNHNDDEKVSREKAIKAIESEQKKLSVISDPGYQANMRFLLARPNSSMAKAINNVGNGGPGLSRSDSANFINIESRPPSARLNGFGPSSRLSRPTSATNGRKSPNISGPYLTQHMRFGQQRPKSAVAAMQNGHELASLYDKILAVSEADQKKDNTIDDLPTKKASKKALKLKKRKKSDAGIEEIRLVRVAVSAFKKRKRLRDIPKSQRGPKKKSAFESVVERVMRIRDEDHGTTYTGRTTITSSRPGTRSSNETMSSSVGSSNSTIIRPKRPESVAQRVLRERKEKKISAKTPVTPKPPKSATSSARPRTTSNGKRQPLHVALRQSASLHGPRALMAQKIKQQAHFNAVKNFQAST
jgi:hypothetical protein